MSKLVMTPGEILRSFKQAESKSKQVGILAELNATSREVIIDVLKEQGVHWRELTRAHSATSTDKKKRTLQRPRRSLPRPQYRKLL